MLARILYAAAAISVLGLFPRSPHGRIARAEASIAAGARSAIDAGAAAIGPYVRARKEPRLQGERICQAGGSHGIGRNPSDFAIPRIDR